MLPGSVAHECLQSVSRRHSQVVQAHCRIQQRQFAPCLPLERPETPDILVVEEALGVPVSKAPDHGAMLAETWYSVKRNMVLTDSRRQTRRV
jgi:hypothetical protein